MDVIGELHFSIEELEYIAEFVGVRLIYYQLKTFSLHSFMERWQRSQFNNLRDNLPDDLALVVIDFAENYVCHYQNQFQAAYYNLPRLLFILLLFTLNALLLTSLLVT